MNRFFPKEKYLKRRSQLQRLTAVVGALGYSLGIVLPALAQINVTLFNQGTATYQTDDGALVNAVTNTIRTDWTKTSTVDLG
ncbi:MAG: hypothetical protein ACO3NK_07780 [Prochlorotrichaceae cyanobacterium]